MLRKILTRFKNQKGFTLVELLAVVVILGIITAIAVPSIGNIMEKAEERAADAAEELVENAARLAHVDGLDLVVVNDSKVYYAGELIENGYLEEPTDYNYDGSDLDKYGYVIVTGTDGTSSVSYEYRAGDVDLTDDLSTLDDSN